MRPTGQRLLRIGRVPGQARDPGAGGAATHQSSPLLPWRTGRRHGRAQETVPVGRRATAAWGWCAAGG